MNLPVADPGVGELVVSLLLGLPKIPDQVAFGIVAQVAAVGHRRAVCVTGSSIGDVVLDASEVSEARL
jgi:hypothetical protein